MKPYGNPKNGKLVLAKNQWGLKEVLLHNGYIDILGDKNYSGRLYSIWRLEQDGEYYFARFNSLKKELLYKNNDWEKIKEAGTDYIEDRFLDDEEVELNV